MAGDGMIGGMKKVGGKLRKPTHTVFAHHKSHMARTGFELTTPSARSER